MAHHYTFNCCCVGVNTSNMKQEVTIGIDLGTTNSVVCVWEDNQVRTLSLAGRTTTPSVVGWNPTAGEWIVGEAARSRLLLHPESVVTSNKRQMGERDFTYKVGGGKYTPVDLAARLLAFLRKEAEGALKQRVTKAVITVPAYFNQNQKKDTQLAAEQAGLEVLQLLAEPTAAAIAYGLDQGKNQTILVYDLGGGTFDLSILEIQNNRFSVISIGGDSDLGGDHFDQAILDHLFKAIHNQYGTNLATATDSQSKQAISKLRVLAEQAKIELTTKKQAELYLPQLLDLGPFEYTIKRSEYEEWIDPLVSRTITLAKGVLQEANMTTDDINRLICVGGASKTPLIQQRLKAEFKQPFLAPNMDEVVGQGAAIAAHTLWGQKQGVKNLPVDLANTNRAAHALGIRSDGDQFTTLIPKNSLLPTSAEHVFSNAIANAEQTEIVVFQGSEALCSQNVCLGGFALTGLPKAQVGQLHIHVRLTLNESELLQVEAWEASTRRKKELRIQSFDPQPFQSSDTKRSLESIRLGVSPTGFDDVGGLLSKIGLRWKKLKNEHFSNLKKLREFDVVFINCLAGGDAFSNKEALATYVEEGGILYASDCAKGHIEAAFPNSLGFSSNYYFNGDTNASIISPDIQAVLGKQEIKINFNAVLYIAENAHPEGEVFLEGTSGGKKHPITLGFPFGKGYVLFTAFHQYKKASRSERDLLKCILLVPISVGVNTPLIDLANRQLKNINY